MKKKTLKERKFKAGYIIREEKVKEKGWKDMVIKSAYNLNGDYIGNSKTAYRLCRQKGIKPELAKKDHNVCSIGFSEKEQKWYGWSHRAIFGFGIENKITESVCGFSKIRKPFRIKSLKEAKKVAIRFAKDIS